MLIGTRKPDIVVLMERFQIFDKTQGLLRCLCFENDISNEEVGRKVWIFWTNVVMVQVD